LIEQILRHFPPHTHPLTLVSDPDGLLADEEVLAALAERGFSVINEPDPIALRHRVAAVHPFSVNRPLVIITAGPLNELPYDLWAQGQPVTLALHTFFPDLAYPVVRTLSPGQRWRLSRASPPPRRLGQRHTITYVLRHIFDVDLDDLARPAELIAWLDTYHQGADPMPLILAEHLLAELRTRPAYAGWPLDPLLQDREAFLTFLREQWLTYVGGQTGDVREPPQRRTACWAGESNEPLAETRAPYVLSFEHDERLQDTLPRLVRSGALSPVPVLRPERLPTWARPAVLAPDQNLKPRRAAELLDALSEHFETPPAEAPVPSLAEAPVPSLAEAPVPSLAEAPVPSLAEARWDRWQTVARLWAELQTLRYDPGVSLDETTCQAWEARLDVAFLGWLRRRYAPLGSQRLPLPHHLHHAPHYMAYRRRQSGIDRIAMLILDGLALSDWTLIGPVWRARHPDWRFQEHLLLAQIPTITAVSRQALASGRRPADFAATLAHNRDEPKLWAAFWRAQAGLPAVACPYARLALERDQPPPPVVDSVRTRALCLIDDSMDDMLHGASQGTADQLASVRLWLDRGSRRLENVIATLLAGGFMVYLASDHGHTQARGMGQPAEGLVVQTRSQRARLYTDRHAAENVAGRFPETLVWAQDGLLPDDVWALMPQGRRAFATLNETVVTHGGLTLDEVVVPLVTISTDLL